MVYEWMERGLLPNFARLAQSGLRAEYALSVDPTVSAPAQSSITTGCYPNLTGIVSNSFHNPNDSFYWYRSGYDELLDQAEPVWVTASRAGLKSAALFHVGGTPQLPNQAADYTIGYGLRDAYSSQITIKLECMSSPWEGEAPASYSPALEGAYTIEEVSPLYLYVLDSSDDSLVNYDTVILNRERRIDPVAPRLMAGQWGSLVLLPKIMAGAEFLIQKINLEKSPVEVTLFQSGVWHNTASPRDLLEGLNQKFGFFRVTGDYYALEHGWITPEDHLHLIEQATRWMAEVTAWVQSAYQPDLLFTWQDPLDAAGHTFFMQDERQLNYSPEAASQHQGYLERAAQMADAALGTMLQSIDLAETTVMLAADHGMAPIHTSVFVNTILEQAGLLRLDRRNYVVVNQSKAIAFPSGGAVHIYINLKDRERDGFVAAEQYEQIQAQIIDLLINLQDPATGYPVFQRVLSQAELAVLNLDHPNSGDIFAQAYPGYNLDGWRGNDFIFAPPDFYGNHGYDSAWPEMRTIFIAAGAGIHDHGKVISPVRITDYAPTIAALLGFTPAPTVAGIPIPAIAPGE